ncbi:peroxiredoxin [Phenylobacterium deserti]|uniref:thioredoxin-dependent peroxiredoxin n=1 Tax=Phenylobacterium deserti TaxID=1914756 RepID=A0A328A8K0_9CAUL|nr:peroxiredoxin [Phenylobacterium deserti]RAK50861.1 peroxiredoxin [Phenylobacterium deserti]
MKRLFVLAAAGAALAAAPAWADLKPGTKAPDFTAPAYLAGKPFTYNLASALKKGPVVLYFFPSAHTAGCNLEARLFSESVDKFKARGATVIGVTAGKVNELADFSRETEHCGGKFPVAADPGAKIATQFDARMQGRNGGPAPELSSRTSYVIGRDGRIAHVYTAMDPTGHVDQTLAAVQKLKVAKR